MSAIKCFGEKDMQYLKEVIDSQELWRGFCSETSFTSKFEDAFAKHLGRKYVLGISSGTNAEEVALAAMGIEPGDEVLCPGVAPIFVSMPVVAVGGVPVFVDVEAETMIMDPAKIEERITDKTKAILVVHLHGVPAKMDEILAVAKKHNLMVMEDCAQAYDAYYKGRKTGTMGDVMCASLQQSKHMTSGEGGIFATDDPEMYKRAVLFHNVGMPWYRFGLGAPEAEPFGGLNTRGHFAFGHNYRMSDLQGAIAMAQLERIDEYHAARAERVAAIEAELADTEGIELAHVHDDCQANYWLYPVRLPEGMGGMEINYIEVAFQKMQADRRTLLGTPLPDYVQYVVGSCPVAEKFSKRFTCLGCHPSSSVEDCVAAARDLKKRVAEFLANN